MLLINRQAASDSEKEKAAQAGALLGSILVVLYMALLLFGALSTIVDAFGYQGLQRCQKRLKASLSRSTSTTTIQSEKKVIMTE